LCQGKWLYIYNKRENYILSSRPHQVDGAEQKIEYNENIKEKKRL
jgi:hypothetical protein